MRDNRGWTKPAAYRRAGTLGRRRAASGQAAIVAMAMGLLTVLILMGTSISQLSAMNTVRTVSDEHSMQAYYVAQAGIQEAIATRMVPRTNYLNFASTNPTEALFPLSGSVFKNPQETDPAKRLRIGYYRYFILGGDPARNKDTAQYDVELSKSLSTSIEQPLYIVSKGTICRVSDKTAANYGKVAENKISVVGARPVCQTGTTAEELIVMAKADMSRSSSSGSENNIAGYREFWPDPNTGADKYITLDKPTLVNGTPTTSFQFEDVWASSLSDAVPLKIAFYSNAKIQKVCMDQNANYCEFNITGPTTEINERINPGATVKLFFRGGVDFRYIYGNTTDYEVNSQQCMKDAENCNILIQQVNPQGKPIGKPHGNSLPVPKYPSNTQLILLPPTDSKLNINGMSRYRLSLKPDFRDYFGRKLGTEYVIDFQTK